jgi:leader peptidase (prepilin peptidase)/N-methyltransferase
MEAAIVAAVFGLLVGSFLNVVIHRFPKMLERQWAAECAEFSGQPAKEEDRYDLVMPRSRCPHCGHAIRWYENIPVLSWLVLRGRCAACRTPIGARYPMVELLGGLLSVAIFEAIIIKMPDSTPAVRALAVYAADFALCMGLLAAAFIDAEHMFLPDSITFGGIAVGLATATLRGLPFTQSLIGAAGGFVGVWLPFTFLYKRVLGRTGMGMGDAKLLALAGAWFGWQGAVFVLFAGALQGSVYALVLKLLGVKSELPAAVQEDIAELEKLAAEGDEEAKKALEEDPLTESAGPRMPFGPFLILACLELLFAGEWIARTLAPFLGPL